MPYENPKETENRKKIYLFIKERYTHKRVSLDNIRMFAKRQKMTPQEMGLSIMQLKKIGAISFRNEFGWVTR
jgi:hypothetical protein